MSGSRILVAEDEPQIRQYVADILATMRDVEVVFAPNGEAAIDRLREGRWDLVISDHRMGPTDGVAVLSEAARVAPEAQRMMITGFAELHVIADATNDAHVHRFLAKPFTPRVFLESVGELIERGHRAASWKSAKSRALGAVPGLASHE